MDMRAKMEALGLQDSETLELEAMYGKLPTKPLGADEETWNFYLEVRDWCEWECLQKVRRKSTRNTTEIRIWCEPWLRSLLSAWWKEQWPWPYSPSAKITEQGVTLHRFNSCD